MTKPTYDNQLPLTYSLPPPPSVVSQPSGRGRGRGQGRGRGYNGYGRFQPLLRQNNQRQQNTYTIKTSEESKVAQPSYKQQIGSTQNSQTLLKKQNDNTFLMNPTIESKKVNKDKNHQQKKSLAKS